MTLEGEPVFRRVLIVLETNRGDGPTLDRAAGLALRHRSELHGLVVEDSELLRIAELPFTREVGGLSGRPRPLETDALRRRLAGYLRRTRRRLRHLSAEGVLPWSLTVTRSRLDTALPATALPDDLLILQRPGHWGGRAQEEVAAAAELAPCPVLVLEPGSSARSAVAVLAGPGPAGRRAAALAAQLALDAGLGSLHILTLPGEAGADRQSAEEAARDLGLQALVYSLASLDTDSLAGTLAGQSEGLLVACRDTLSGAQRRELALRPGPGLLLVP